MAEKATKSVTGYTDREAELMEEAISAARDEHDAEGCREGEAVAQVCAAYLECTGPLEGKLCPICGDRVTDRHLPDHIVDCAAEDNRGEA